MTMFDRDPAIHINNMRRARMRRNWQLRTRICVGMLDEFRTKTTFSMNLSSLSFVSGGKTHKSGGMGGSTKTCNQSQS
eukprot:scaffold34603_cov212-Amphora_coffeaeformis.AAC.25